MARPLLKNGIMSEHIPFLAPTDICKCGSLDIALLDSEYGITTYADTYQCDICSMIWKITYQIVKIEQL